MSENTPLLYKEEGNVEQAKQTNVIDNDREGESNPMSSNNRDTGIAELIVPNKKVETGWFDAWNLEPILKDMFVRDRKEEFYPLDCLRALAYLWVNMTHYIEGLEKYYSSSSLTTSLSSYFGTNGYQIVYSNSGQGGVTVFFVLSGFLITYVFVGISRKNQVSYSMKCLLVYNNSCCS